MSLGYSILLSLSSSSKLRRKARQLRWISIQLWWRTSSVWMRWRRTWQLFSARSKTTSHATSASEPHQVFCLTLPPTFSLFSLLLLDSAELLPECRLRALCMYMKINGRTMKAVTLLIEVCDVGAQLISPYCYHIVKEEKHLRAINKCSSLRLCPR